jgi:uncharacterized protein (TIGR02996 family)
MEDRAAELEAAIARDPDDPEPYLIYADWLQGIGDPRGTLIVLQHHGRVEEADALISAHRKDLLGPLADFPAGPVDGRPWEQRRLELAWHLGYLREARIAWGRSRGRRLPREVAEAREALAALLALPSSRYLRHLAIEAVPFEDTADFAPFLEAIARAPRLPPLRSLFVGRRGDDPARLGPVEEVLRACPELRHLALRAGELELGERRHPELRAFGIESHLVTSAHLSDLGGASLPRLERLELSFQHRGELPAFDLEELARLLEGDGFRSVRHLAVRHCGLADDLVIRLADAPLLRRLVSLDLSGGGLTARGVAAIARARLAFSHLARLELEHNLLSDAACGLARGLGRHVHVGVQDGDPDAA